ncbi:hypothetical protein AB0K34_13530 [Actinomadura sp. NPDC049382]|uniref:hypothetical protein n=1 Tax=Actinomadura sp. NPDC049382 TaxID=3158220 RepID=UPI00342BCEA2
MTAALSPAEIRTGQRLRALYGEAAAHILAEEQAAEAASVPTGTAMVADRFADLTATPETRAAFSAYLDRLASLHPDDNAMGAYIASARAAIAAAEAPSLPPHLEVA